MPKRLNIFEVMDVMVQRGMDVRLSPLENVRQVSLIQQGGKHGTIVAIGIDGDVVFRLSNGMFVGGLLLVDKEQFNTVKAELQEAKRISSVETGGGDGGNGNRG